MNMIAVYLLRVNGESDLKFSCESYVAHSLPKTTVSSILSSVLVMSVLYYPFYL